ncbi:hypothetical protein AMAG_20232 [Allomyces macrogynus ATCC 38327]|uniref:Uncharacterized protein n=1 Tax=Allomyces macrogynus (strain ATCC 38327) TaxID=578462 RepID=A0A0L0T5W4_ALLM3|nr:hypothetical protein AMAG_20232 [Allomyces macrogynus ATCC 38327]|eukprot:KNE70071.1 hypothetical protein AMAG_20232 [Allomyces macrogynus ATCC 38327]
MSTAAVIPPTVVSPIGPAADYNFVNVAAKTTSKLTPKENTLAAHADALCAGGTADAVNTDAVTKLLGVIGEQMQEVVSRDLLLAIPALSKAIAKDATLVENPPLLPLDVAMFWHAHAFCMRAISPVLNPVRYSDDAQRLFGPAMIKVTFPLMPANEPFDLTPASTMDVLEYFGFRSPEKAHACASCNASFTAENVAVRRFLTKVAQVQAAAAPQDAAVAPKVGGNVADLHALLDAAVWAPLVVSLPAVPTWGDVE